MREIRQSGSVGGEPQSNAASLPLLTAVRKLPTAAQAVMVRYCHGQTDATLRIALPSIHSVQRLGSEQDRSTTITESPPKTSPCQAPSTGHFGVWFCSGCSSCSCSRSCSCSCSIDHGIVPFRLGGCTGSIRVCNAMDERERNHGLRDEPINLVVRVEDRKDAMPSNRSITSTSTVRDSGLSTSTMGSCGRVGQNKALSSVGVC
jgi:anti-sigma factor RsiW